MRRKTEGRLPRVDAPSHHIDHDTRGPLVLIGGACTPDGEALRSFIDLAHASGGPIVGITAASENPVQSARLWRADFRAAGVQDIEFPRVKRANESSRRASTTRARCSSAVATR